VTTEAEHEVDKRPIIIKRVKKIKKGGSHGGSWKIAYADFVTAMMAFFLLMWLLGMLNKSQLAGVAKYFKNPEQHAAMHDIAKYNEKPNPAPPPQQQAKVENKTPITKVDPSPAQMKQILLTMKGELENKLQSNPQLSEFKNQLNFKITAEGLEITISDLKDKPMFSVGKADFEKYANQVLTFLATTLNQYPNRIEVIGHTDDVPYGTDNYTNWELSADRANATRRALVKNGMDDTKFVRIVGVADTQPLTTDKTDVGEAKNRRIQIIVLSADAAKRIGSS
jgi:chemotaxis protein MotB